MIMLMEQPKVRHSSSFHRSFGFTGRNAAHSREANKPASSGGRAHSQLEGVVYQRIARAHIPQSSRAARAKAARAAARLARLMGSASSLDRKICPPSTRSTALAWTR